MAAKRPQEPLEQSEAQQLRAQRREERVEAKRQRRELARIERDMRGPGPRWVLPAVIGGIALLAILAFVGYKTWSNAVIDAARRPFEESHGQADKQLLETYASSDWQKIAELKKKAENEDVKEYQESLANLLPFQRKDFLGIFEAMDGYPVIIRLIDPPMHEFLPPREELLIEVTELRCTGRDPEELKKKEYLLQVVESLWETNPMLGLRGCRAGLMYPGLTEMQVQAIMEAAVEVKKAGVDVHPEIMIPLTSHVNEMHAEHDKLKKVAEKVLREAGMDNLAYKIGTMIEIPRAALTADEIAESAEFFSFGTNDLTQMTFGISRDDAEGKFLLNFVDRGLLPSNPFQVIDREGVGQLMKLCVDKGRSTRPDLEIGICGEHGGEPSSIEFCHMIGLNYVSCSPYRVPIARLAAAHAQLNHPKN